MYIWYNSFLHNDLLILYNPAVKLSHIAIVDEYRIYNISKANILGFKFYSNIVGIKES